MYLYQFIYDPCHELAGVMSESYVCTTLIQSFLFPNRRQVLFPPLSKEELWSLGL